MIVPYTPMTEISITELDRVINELEAMLEGKLDYSNLAVSNEGVFPVPTNSVVDVDGYFKSMKFIAGETDSTGNLFPALDSLDSKLSLPYDTTVVDLGVTWAITTDSRASSGTVGGGSSLVSIHGAAEGVWNKDKDAPVPDSGLSYAQRGREYTRSKAYNSWDSTETGFVDKGRDLIPVTYREFFEKVWESIPLAGVEQIAYVFNVDLDAPVISESIEYTAKHVPSDTYIEISKVGGGEDAQSISRDYKCLIAYNAVEGASELAVSLSIKTAFLLRRII